MTTLPINSLLRPILLTPWADNGERATNGKTWGISSENITTLVSQKTRLILTALEDRHIGTTALSVTSIFGIKLHDIRKGI